jgi:hypothetical protein
MFNYILHLEQSKEHLVLLVFLFASLLKTHPSTPDGFKSSSEMVTVDIRAGEQGG